MFNFFFIVAVFVVYISVLFLIAEYVERKSATGKNIGNHPLVYSLSLTVFVTTWTFYGAVGVAAESGILYVTTYLGPTLIIFFWWYLLKKIIKLKELFRITSIADFISVRYNKSYSVAAIVTIISIIGIIPYISIQLKSIVNTVNILSYTQANSVGNTFQHFTGPLVTLLMILFIIIFGSRKLDPTEKHQGVMVAVAVSSIVKLIAFITVGIFVSYTLFDNIQEIFSRVESQSAVTATGSSTIYITWFFQLLLGMSAIMFLPRQFHVLVVENFHYKHIRTAQWLLPAYMLLLTFFVVPIAFGGTLLGYPLNEADTFVLTIPFNAGQRWISLIVFLGGFSAAFGMILVSGMAMGIMITNHIIIPVIRKYSFLMRIRRYVLQLRWLTVTIYISICYLFYTYVSDKFTIVNIGFISFAAVIQFVPAIIGGLYWVKGNKTGAILGLSSGFVMWLYTLVYPALMKSGIIANDVLINGPFGIGFLKPEGLLGFTMFDPLSHSVFWSLLINIAFYILGSILFEQKTEERLIAEQYLNALRSSKETKPRMSTIAYISIAEKSEEIRKMLEEFYNPAKVDLIIKTVSSKLKLEEKNKITIAELVEFQKEIETYLAGSIGAAAAHRTIVEKLKFSSEEEKYLTEFYSGVLANLKLKPSDLKEKVDYYQEREKILNRQAFELEEKIKERDIEITERKRIESELSKMNRTLRILIESNHAIVHAESEESMIKNICDIIVSRGNYHMAWIGYFLPDGKIRPAVYSGFENGFLDAILSDSLEESFLKGEILKKVKRKMIYSSENIFTDPIDEEWLKEALKRNYYSMIFIPLVNNEEVFGVFALFTNSPNSYSDEEKILLTELAKDISYGVESLRLRKEQVIAEKALHESEERYRSIFEFNATALIIIDKSAMIIRANKKAAELFGYAIQEIEGKKRWAEFIAHEKDLNRLNKIKTQVLLKKFFSPIEEEFTLKDSFGNEREVIVTGSLLSGTDSMIVSLVEITERKHAEEILKDSERRLAEIIDFLPDATFVINNNKEIIIWNTAIEEMTGVKKEEMLGKDDYEYAIPFYGERRAVLIDYLFDKITDIEDRYLTFEYKDQKISAETFVPRVFGGKGAYLAGLAAPLYNQSGEMIGAIESLRDITEHRLAEENLRLQKEYFQQLFENTPSAIALIDQNNCILNVNKSFESLFGYPLQEIKDKNLDQIIPEFTTSSSKTSFQSAEGSYLSEISFLKADKTTVTAGLLSFPIHIAGSFVGTYKIYSDVTEQKKLEDQLRQSQKMEAIGTLAGGIAHDFNNILTAIMGYANLLRLKMDDADPLRTYSDHIISSSRKASILTQSLLAFSRKQIINPKSVNLNETITQFEKLLLRMIGEDIELHSALSTEDLIVFADASQIEQVIMNLVVNARDAMPTGGIISISTSKSVKTINSEKKEYALLTISDNGCGMDSGTVQRIFEPFFTTKEQGKGTGLGLAIVYGIIKQHNGEISVYSEKKKGTSFKIYLPISKSEIKTGVSDEPVVLSGGTETILLAEDDDDVRRLGKSILEEYGYKVLEAKNGEEAVEIFRHDYKIIDLLMLDVVMPKMNGKEAYDIIKKINPNVKVLFTSGYTSDIIFKKGILDSEYNFLSKPATVDALLRKVRQVLEK